MAWTGDCGLWPQNILAQQPPCSSRENNTITMTYDAVDRGENSSREKGGQKMASNSRTRRVTRRITRRMTRKRKNRRKRRRKK